MRANGQPVARNTEIHQKGKGKHAAWVDAAHCVGECSTLR